MVPARVVADLRRAAFGGQQVPLPRLWKRRRQLQEHTSVFKWSHCTYWYASACPVSVTTATLMQHRWVGGVLHELPSYRRVWSVMVWAGGPDPIGRLTVVQGCSHDACKGEQTWSGKTMLDLSCPRHHAQLQGSTQLGGWLLRPAPAPKPGQTAGIA